MREPILKAVEYLENVCQLEPKELEAVALIRDELETNSAMLLRMDATIHKIVKDQEVADMLTRGENV